MHDLKKIITEPQEFKADLERCGEDGSVVAEVITLDKQRRDNTLQLDKARAARNEISRAIGLAKRAPNEDEKNETRKLGDEIALLEKKQRQVEADLRAIMLTIPNLPLPDVPDGEDEKSNIVTKTVGNPEPAAHGKAHWDIAAELGLFDMEAAANTSGARFYFLKGAGARLNRALTNWMLDVNTEQFGYTEIEAPVLVKKETMTSSGNLPKFYDNLYHDDETDLWLIPTAEVALNGYHQGKIITDGMLPCKFVSSTNCFRKEHTSAGRDVRGIKRVHQFQKVELFRIEKSEHAEDAQNEMIAQIEQLCTELGLAYRIVKLCAGDLGFQSARTFDVEVWAAGSRDWLEVSSISTCGDFQARRSGMRYKVGGGKPIYPHTLNGSALALPRIWAAIIEKGYDNGIVQIPAVLQPYLKQTQIGKEQHH